MEIRPLEAQDKPYLMSLIRDTPEFSQADFTVAEEVLDSYLRDSSKSGYCIFVAWENSRILGYICYGPTPLTQGTWDIYWIAVARDVRGKGVGESLLNYAEERIKEAEGRLTLIETSSRQDYERARRFYHSVGYEEIAHVPNFYMPGDDKLILWKKLK